METCTAEKLYETEATLSDTMRAAPRTSILGLIRNLRTDFKTFVRQEINLAKTEITEKISSAGKNAVALAVGGFIAYAGLIVLLIGFGWLLSFAFQKAGLQPAFATFLGLAIIGLVIAMLGGAFVANGIRAFKEESMAPQRTLHTLQELKGGKTMETMESDSQEAEEPEYSSEDLEGQVEQTEYQMGATLDELGYRLSPRYLNARLKSKVRENPYRAGLIAAGVGVLSGLVLRRKFRHA